MLQRLRLICAATHNTMEEIMKKKWKIALAIAAIFLAIGLVFISCNDDDDTTTTDCPVAAKTALKEKIDEAKELKDGTEVSANGNGLDDGKWWAPQTAHDSLQSAITTAENVHDTTGTTKAHFDNAKKALETGIETFEDIRKQFIWTTARTQFKQRIDLAKPLRMPSLSFMA